MVPSLSFQLKELYNPKAFIIHAVLLDQAFAHCPIFPTAASRRSLGRVSVPVWLIILSDQLPIIALVGRYPTNKLIGRRLLHRRLAPLTLRCHAVLAAVSRCYPPPMDRYLRVTHPSATRGCPLVRLACVKHAASVRSEPGSNSQVHHPNPQAETRKPEQRTDPIVTGKHFVTGKLRDWETASQSRYTPRHGWIRLSPIVQYSPLLPPVGVWTVSQFQCD